MRLPTVVTVLVALCGVLIFYTIRNRVAEELFWNADEALPVFLIALAGALVFVRVGYGELPNVYRILTRTTALGVLAYLIWEPPDFTLANVEHARLAAYVEWGYWVGLAAAVVSLWRPSLLYPAALYVIASRFVVDDISGFGLSTLDVRYMAEMAQFLAMGTCGLALMRLGQSHWGGREGYRILDMIDLRLLALCLAFIATGFHLGNYFWSGVAKVGLGPHPWTWALENQTQNIMLAALKRGVLPTGALPQTTQAIFDGFGQIVTLSNVFVVLTQVSAIFAVLRVNWLRIATLAYDVLHIGIFLIGGLFFWPWIWNNVSILLAVRRTSDQEIGPAPKLCCIVAILLGGFSLLGGSARLAWWDVVDIKIPMIQAQVEGGDWVDVPVSYFLSHSYAASHGYFDMARTQGHYEPTIWGSVPSSYQRAKTSGTCPEPPHLDTVESEQAQAQRLARVKRFIRAHHRKIMERVDENGHYDTYLRSHHHPSNPWMYDAFNSLDLRKIKRYRLLTQSVCMSMSDGRLAERVNKEDSVNIEIND